MISREPVHCYGITSTIIVYKQWRDLSL